MTGQMGFWSIMDRLAEIVGHRAIRWRRWRRRRISGVPAGPGEVTRSATALEGRPAALRPGAEVPDGEGSNATGPNEGPNGAVAARALARADRVSGPGSALMDAARTSSVPRTGCRMRTPCGNEEDQETVQWTVSPTNAGL